MRPTKQLILGFREAASRLRDYNVKYAWDKPCNCNCGILAQAILGLTGDQLFERYQPCGTWSSYAEYNMRMCADTGIPHDELFKILQEAGLELGDYNLIEYVGGIKLCSDREYVAVQFDQWADELERKRRNETNKVTHPRTKGDRKETTGSQHQIQLVDA